MSINLFTPAWNGTVSVAATSGASLRVTLTTAAGQSVRIKNVSGTNTVYVALGTAAVTATTTGGFPVGIGETVGVSRNPFTDVAAAAITAADVATVYFTVGEGE